MKTFKLRLLDGEVIDVREVARVGEFVAHSSWQSPNGRKTLVITHAPTMIKICESYAKIVKLLMAGSRSGKTLARLAKGVALQQLGHELDERSDYGRAYRALRKYQRKLEATTDL